VTASLSLGLVTAQLEYQLKAPTQLKLSFIKSKVAADAAKAWIRRESNLNDASLPAWKLPVAVCAWPIANTPSWVLPQKPTSMIPAKVDPST